MHAPSSTPDTHSVFTIRLAGLQRRCTWEDAMYLIGEANGIAPERRDGEADAIRAAIRDELRHVVFRNTFTGIDEHACPDPQFYSEPVVCNVRGVICTTTDHERALLNGATVESVTPVTPGYRQIHGMACTVA